MKTRAEINQLENRKIVETINETKKLVLWKHHKTDKPLARLKTKKEKTQINNIMNEPGGIMTDPVDIRRVKKHDKQLYTHKFNNTDEIDHFVKKQAFTTNPIWNR